MQQLARDIIGVKDVDWQRGLLFEQTLLLKELRIVQQHLELLQTEISAIVTNCREGQILLFIPPIGLIQAATIIAAIGTLPILRKLVSSKPISAGLPEETRQEVLSTEPDSPEAEFAL